MWLGIFSAPFLNTPTLTELDIGDIVRVSKDINRVRNLNRGYIPYTR